MHRWFEAKLKEEAYSVSRALDVKLEKQKIEINKQINENITQTAPSMNEYVSRTELEQFKAQLLSSVKDICFDKIESLKDTLTQEMRNIYKVINGLIISEQLYQKKKGCRQKEGGEIILRLIWEIKLNGILNIKLTKRIILLIFPSRKIVQVCYYF